MPSLLEQIGQKRYDQGVTVYSPTRQLIRPQGGVANAGTAQQIMGGGAPSGGYRPSPQLSFTGGGPQLGQMPQGGGPQLGPMPQGGPAPPMTTLDQMLAQSQAAAQQPVEEPSGFAGVIGTVVNNPISRAIMAPLQVLDIPRRLVASTVQETADAFNGGDASFSDWTEQVGDESFGFGDIVPDTGNIWADRFIGLAGDILLDPLTYVGGASMLSGAGRGARVGAAARSVAHGFSDEITQGLGRLGWSSVDADARAAARLAGEAIHDPGYRFRIPGLMKPPKMVDGELVGGGVRIPGTGRMEQGVSSFFAKGRAAFNEKMPGMSRLRYWRTEEGLGDATEKLVTGRGNMPLAEAAEIVNFTNAHGMAKRTVMTRINQEGQRLMKDHNDKELTDMIHLAETAGGTPVNKFYDSAHDMADEYGVQFAGRKNYVPHFLTEEAWNWIKGDTPAARAFKKEFELGDEINNVSPVLLERKLVAREKPYDINGKEFNIKEGSIKEWNAEFARVVPEAGAKFFDDNFSTILTRYAMGLSDDVGIVRAVKHLLQSKSGLVRGFNDDGALKEVVNDALNKHANDITANQLRAELANASDITRKIKEDTLKGVSGIQGLLGVQLRGALDEMTTLADDTKLAFGHALVDAELYAGRVGAGPYTPGGAPVPVRPAGPGPEELAEQAAAQGGAVPYSVVPVGKRPRWRGEVPEHRAGTLEREFDKATLELDTKIDAIDVEMAKVSMRAATEQGIFREAAAGAKVSRLTMQNMGKATKKWNDLVARRTLLASDRETLRAIGHRLHLHQLKADIIDRGIEDPHFLSLAAGRDVKRRVVAQPGEIRTTDGGYRAVGREEIYRPTAGLTMTPSMVRRDYQKRREAILGQTPELQDMGADIIEQEKVVAQFEQDLERAALIHGPAIQAARDSLVVVRGEEAALKSRLDDLDSPGLQEARDATKRELKALRDGRLREAQELYEVTQRPVVEARTNASFQTKLLDAQKRRQEEVARGSAVGGKALPSASTPTAPPTPEDLPYTPQHLGQVRKSLQRDRNTVSTWNKGPEHQQVRELDVHNQELMKQRREVEGDVARAFGSKEWFIAPHRAPFTVDRNGNIIPNLDATDRVGMAVIRERDDAAEMLTRAQKEVDRVEQRVLSGVTDDPTEYNAAVKARDAQAAIVQKYDNQIMKENLDRYRGTQMARSLEQAQDAKWHLYNIDVQLRKNHDQQTRLQRKIAPVRTRIEANKALLDEQAAVIARNAELLNPTSKPVPKGFTLDERIASLNRDEAEVLRQAKQSHAGYKTEWEPVPEFTGREMAVHPSERSEFFEGRRMTLEPDDEAELVSMYEQLAISDDPDIVRRARTTIQEIEARRGPGKTHTQMGVQDAVEESLAAVQRIQNAREIFPEAALTEAGQAAVKKVQRQLTKSNKIVDRAGLARKEMDRATNTVDDLLIREAILNEDVAQYQRVQAELDRQYRIYTGDLVDEQGEPLLDPTTGDKFRPNPSRQVTANLEQAVSEASRQTEFMLRLKAVIDSGATPSDSLSALVLMRTLGDEWTALNKQIVTTRALIEGGLTKRMANYEAKIARHSNKIEEQRTILARLDQQLEESPLPDQAALRETQKADRRKAQQVMGDQARQIRNLNHPDTGIVDAEVEAMVQFLEQQVNDIHTANMRLNDARWMRDRVEWPHKQRALLEASIPHWTAVVEEQKWSLRNRRQAIDKARAEGRGTVSFVDYEQNKNIVLSLEDARKRLAEIPAWRKNQRAEIRAAINKTEAAAKRLEAPGAKRTKKAVEESLFVKYTPFNDKPTTMTIEQAETDIEAIERGINSVETSLEADSVLLGVLNGTNEQELNELNRVLADVQQPPDRAVLQGRLDRLAAKQRPSEGDMAKMNLLQARIHMIDNPATADEVAQWTQRRNKIQEAQDTVDEVLGADRARLMAVVDSGQEFLTRIVNTDYSVAKMSQQDMTILRDLVGAEGAEVARQWISALNAVLEDRGYSPGYTRIEVDEIHQLLSKHLRGNIGTGGAAGDREIARWSEKIFDILEYPFESDRPSQLGVARREALLGIVDEIQAATGGIGQRSEWYDELSKALTGGRQLSSDDVVEIVNELQELVGDSPLSQFIARNVMEKVEGGSGATAERFKTELLNGVIASAKAERDNDLRNFAQMFRSMGLTVFTGRSKEAIQKELDALVGSIRGIPTKSQNEAIQRLQQELGAPGLPYTEKTPLQAMGFRMGAGTLDRRQMKAFVIQQYQAQGFDPMGSLQDRLLTMELRGNRIKTMQHGLGLRLSMDRLKDPETFFRQAWGEADPSVRPRPPEQDVAEVLELSKQLDEAHADTAVVSAQKPEVVPEAPPRVMSGRSQDEIEADVMSLMDQFDPEDPNMVAKLDQLQEELQGGPIEQAAPEGEPAPPLTPEPEAAAPAPPPAAAPAARPSGRPRMQFRRDAAGRMKSAEGYLIDADRAPGAQAGWFRATGPNGEDLGAHRTIKEAEEIATRHLEHGGPGGMEILPQVEEPPFMEAAPAAPAGVPPEAWAKLSPEEQAAAMQFAQGGEQPLTALGKGEDMATAVGTLGTRWKTEGKDLWRSGDWTIHKQADGKYYLIDGADRELGSFTNKRAAQAAAKGAPPAAAAAPTPAAAAPPPPEPLPPSLLPGKLDEVNAKLEALHNKRASGVELTPAENATMSSLYNEMEEIELELATIEDLPELLARRHPRFVQGEDFSAEEFAQEAAELNMSRAAYAEYQGYEGGQARVEAGRTNRIAYDWRTIMKEGTPNYNVARKLKKSNTGFEATARRMSGANVRPSGAFTKNLMTSQEARVGRPAKAIQDEMQRLREMRQRTEEALKAGRIDEEEAALQITQNEGYVAQLEQEYNEQLAFMRGEDVEAEAKRVAEKAETEVRALQVERGKLGMDRWRAQQNYTRELQENQIQLGNTRGLIAAAHNDHDILDRTADRIRRVLETTPTNTAELTPLLEDLRVVNRMRKGMTAGDTFDPERMVDEEDIVSVEAMIDSAIDSQMELNNAEFTEQHLMQRLRNFDNGEALVNPVVKRAVRDGWQQIASHHLKGKDATYMADSLARAVRNLDEGLESKGFWKMVEKYTAFFKTYATATPGFHVRNALSGLFMNLVDGVRMKHTARAPQLWSDMRKNPKKFWAGATEEERMAFAIVSGSGAGGQFLERGVGPEMEPGSKAYRALMNNVVTRWNKRAGEWVEGPIRLAMALDSLERGMSMHAALERVTRFHFNYNQVSSFDRRAKRLIPFWTFMSRNLPLQIQQMWVRPKAYLWYQSFQRNFAEVADPMTPEYWLAQGAFTMDQNAEKSDSPWYLAPDLPHLRIAEPFVAAGKGDWGKAVLSDLNPAFMAPFEAYGARKKFYTGQPIEGYSKPEGTMDWLTPIFQMLGQTETGGTTGETLVSESAQHLARSLLPTLQLSERLTSTEGTRAGRQGETMVRALGAPVYKLTPELRQSTRRRQYMEKKAKRESQRDLAQQ